MMNGAIWPGWINSLMPLVGSIAVFLVAWVVAAAVAGAVGRILKRSNVDAQFAKVLPRQSSTVAMRQWMKGIVFWSILLIGVLFAIQVLNIATVSGSVNSLLNPILGYVPKLISAVALVGLAWAIATVSRLLVIRSAQSLQLDETLNGTSDSTSIQFESQLESQLESNFEATARPAKRSVSLSETLGNLLYGLVFLFFLPLVLEVLELRGPLAPVQGLLSSILAAVPLIFKAGLIGTVGWFAAKLVRSVVTNLLSAVGVDRIGQRFAVSSAGSRPLNLSEMGGTIAFIFVLIPAAIATVDALGIPAISGPATAMLGQFLSAVPLIFTAGAVLAGAYFVGRFVADLVSSLLASLGFDGIFRVLGVEPPRSAAQKTPSQVAGMISHLAIMLVAAITATNILQIPALTAIASGLTLLLGQVLVGVLIFGIGLYLANLAHGVILSTGTPQSSLLAKTAKYAILVFVSAMALQQMGIAASIVNLAFGLLLGSIAVGLAIAFGLGGRDVAGRQLQRLVNHFDDGASHPSNGNQTHYPPGVPANPNLPMGYQRHDSHPLN